MEVYISKVTSRGQVTIPQEMRDEVGITEEDYVTIRRVGKYIVVGKAEMRLDDITSAFEKEAKKRKVSKAELVAGLDKVRQRKAAT